MRPALHVQLQLDLVRTGGAAWFAQDVYACAWICLYICMCAYIISNIYTYVNMYIYDFQFGVAVVAVYYRLHI